MLGKSQYGLVPGNQAKASNEYREFSTEIDAGYALQINRYLRISRTIDLHHLSLLLISDV